MAKIIGMNDGGGLPPQQPKIVDKVLSILLG